MNPKIEPRYLTKFFKQLEFRRRNIWMLNYMMARNYAMKNQIFSRSSDTDRNLISQVPSTLTYMHSSVLPKLHTLASDSYQKKGNTQYDDNDSDRNSKISISPPNLQKHHSAAKPKRDLE